MGISKSQQRDLNTAARHGATSLIKAAESIAPGKVVELLAEQLVSTRRSSVAVLGDVEAFVRKTPDGSLGQVIRPVQLTVGRGDLFQIPKRVPVDVATGEVVDNLKGHRGTVRWESRPTDPRRATLTVQGMQVINQVAGIQVATPPTVMVDGHPRSNPYVERAPGRNGRPGDITRIVMACVVIGAVPATGNPVAVNYALEYSPERELLAMAANMLGRWKDSDGTCPVTLVTEQEFDAANRPATVFVPLYGGMGYAINIRHPKAAEMYSDFANILTNMVKKCQTVAMRNALRRHPALGAYQSVEVNERGEAVLAIIGWAGTGATLARYQGLAAMVSAGASLGDIQKQGLMIEVSELTETYKPEEDDAPDVVIVESDHTDAPLQLVSPAVEHRARLQAELYQLASQAQDLGVVLDFNPDEVAGAPMAQLEGAVMTLRDRVIEAGSQQPEAFPGDDAEGVYHYDEEAGR
jgi:hypothetical protein